MKGALVTFIAKVDGVVNEKFPGAPPQTPTFFAPPIKISGGATVSKLSVLQIVRGALFSGLVPATKDLGGLQQITPLSDHALGSHA